MTQNTKTTKPTQDSTLPIDAWSLTDLLSTFQQGILDGYRLDITSNDNYPVHFGTRYMLTMVPEGYQEAQAALKPKVEWLGSPANEELAVEASSEVKVDADVTDVPEVKQKGEKGKKAK